MFYLAQKVFVMFLRLTLKKQEIFRIIYSQHHFLLKQESKFKNLLSVELKVLISVYKQRCVK